MKRENAVAFKEWQVVVDALGRGEQMLILRKGGVQERFVLEESEFWFFPTYTHQKLSSVRPEYRDRVRASGPLAIQHYAQVVFSKRIESPAVLARLAPYHIWSEPVVLERFRRWKEEGVTGFVVRVFSLPEPRLLESRPEYAGCKSWVTLRTAVATDGLKPVLPDDRFERLVGEIRAQMAS